MKLGVQLFGCAPLLRDDPEAFLRKLKEMGYDLVEPCVSFGGLSTPFSWDFSALPEYKAMTDRLGLDLDSCHAFAKEFWNCVPDMAVAQEKLCNFSSASVREKKAAEALGLDLPVCCDPVFLMDREFWSKLADESSVNIAKPYLFVYQVRYSDQFLGRAKDLAAARGLELVVLSAKVEQENSPCVAQAGPADFVKLIRDASVVMTNSFHGTALSMIFGKEYYSPRMDDGKDSRVESLLRTGADVEASVEFLKSCGL